MDIQDVLSWIKSEAAYYTKEEDGTYTVVDGRTQQTTNVETESAAMELCGTLNEKKMSSEH